MSKEYHQYRETYNYCGICGHVPGEDQEPNRAPVRWWDADDGWKIGSLCRCCFEDTRTAQPKPGDLAYEKTNGIADNVNTDEDIIETMMEAE